MNKVFFTSDTHFGHANIIRYENRPFASIDEMDKALIENWNRVVSKNDLVFHCGDVSFYDKEKTKEIISQLNGRKILIKGNHDKRTSQWWLDVGFDEVSNYPIVYKEWFVLQHEPPNYINNDTPFLYVYGHVHSTELYPTVAMTAVCVCTERWNYAPVELETIKELVTAEHERVMFDV